MTAQTRIFSRALLLCITMWAAPLIAHTAEVSVQEADDFQTLQKEMRDKKLPLLVAFRADYCGYCARLEREYLEPMVKSGNYTNRILIRQFSIDKNEKIIDFNGDRISADDFSYRYKASITPTLIFLNAQGEEVAERLLGYNSPDFYGAYLENSIDAAYKAVNNEQ